VRAQLTFSAEWHTFTELHQGIAKESFSMKINKQLKQANSSKWAKACR
jgi:hypothetical protein